ncbi:CBS domain-containing protein [Salinigranum salinum]|uniref:CBS domain-containing protein n=1 Tax=Salinigranum salinum TaxID=1364937 RepID=UPI001864135C|nr:CBS domain-containing protein [Salinigranum salinum]
MDLDGTPVARLMTTGVFTVTPDTSVTAAAETLLLEEIGSLVVVDEEGRPVGMLTNTDLVGIVSAGELDGEATVEQYMSDRIVTIGERNSIRDAAAKMITNGIHHLPVTDDEGGIVGILSTMDLTAHLSYTTGTETE